MNLNRLALACSLLLLSSAFAAAQNAKPVNSGNVGGGFAITGGNSDTENFNLTFAFVHDPMASNVFKTNASYLRGKQSKLLSVDRTAVNIRDEWKLSSRAYVFAQNDYLRDRFKQIIFAWIPVGGVGYKLVNGPSTQLTTDMGVGAFIEKNPGLPTSKSGDLSAGEHFQTKLSSNATFTQLISANWKTSDFADSLTNFSAGLTTSVAKKIELKVDFIDNYKNKPTTGAKKNDTAFVTAFVVKF